MPGVCWGRKGLARGCGKCCSGGKELQCSCFFLPGPGPGGAPSSRHPCPSDRGCSSGEAAGGWAEQQHHLQPARGGAAGTPGGHTRSCMRTHAHVHTQVHTHAHAYACMRTLVHTRSCTYSCTYMCMHTCSHILTCARTHAHTHIHVCSCSLIHMLTCSHMLTLIHLQMLTHVLSDACTHARSYIHMLTKLHTHTHACSLDCSLARSLKHVARGTSRKTRGQGARGHVALGSLCSWMRQRPALAIRRPRPPPAPLLALPPRPVAQAELQQVPGGRRALSSQRCLEPCPGCAEAWSQPERGCCPAPSLGKPCALLWLHRCCWHKGAAKGP